MEQASKTGLGTILGGLLCDRSYCYCIRDSGGVAEGSARKVKLSEKRDAVPIFEIPLSPLAERMTFQLLLEKNPSSQPEL